MNIQKTFQKRDKRPKWVGQLPQRLPSAPAARSPSTRRRRSWLQTGCRWWWQWWKKSRDNIQNCRKPYHKKCVKCKSCSKALTPATLNEHQTQLYCLVFSLSSAWYHLNVSGGLYNPLPSPATSLSTTPTNIRLDPMVASSLQRWWSNRIMFGIVNLFL